MQRKLTITISDEVYRGLHQRFGRREISRFIEGLIRPHVVSADDLENEYLAAAEDLVAERDVQIWLEAGLDEALD